MSGYVEVYELEMLKLVCELNAKWFFKRDEKHRKLPWINAVGYFQIRSKRGVLSNIYPEGAVMRLGAVSVVEEEEMGRTKTEEEYS